MIGLNDVNCGGKGFLMSGWAWACQDLSLPMFHLVATISYATRRMVKPGLAHQSTFWGPSLLDLWTRIGV